MQRIIVTALLLAALACASNPRASASTTSSRPLVDHHQHLFSPAIHAYNSALPQRDARAVVAQLDSVGIRRAAVLSVAYMYANPNRPPVEHELEKVRAENAWTAAQVAEFPGRLVGVCSVNPLKEYALDEIARCAANPNLRAALKMHFGNSDVQLDDTAHVARLRRVFQAAQQHRMGIVIHMRSSVTRKRPYGAATARAFLDLLVPAAPDVPIQIAHLAGAGGYDDPGVDSAVAVFVDAVKRGDPRMRNVYFDISGGIASSRERHALVVQRIRELGIERMLYGSDAAVSVVDEYASFHTLPLTADEFRRIESNVAPYMR